MAPKLAPKRVPLEEPPSASSSSYSASSEEEQMIDKKEEDQVQEQTKQDAESEEEEGSEDDEEEEEENNKPSLQKPTSVTTKPPQPHSSSESDEGSDSEIHSPHCQPSPNASDVAVKPIASKPMYNATKPKKPTSKAAVKRPAADSEKNGMESQKKKTKVSNGDEEEKKSGGAVNRLWSEDDEIVILKGMIDYKSKKGADPNADLGDFHEFIKKSLHVDVSKNQLMDKIRRLKKKYANNAEKGEDPVFSKPHEHKCFELSKKIWGGGNHNNAVDVNGKSGSKRARKIFKVNNPVASPQKNVNEVRAIEGFKGEIKDIKVDKVEDFWSMLPYLKRSLEMETSSCLSMKEPVKDFMLERMSLIGNEKAMQLEKKWKNLRVDEVALYLKRVELIKEQSKLVLDAMKALQV